MYEISKWGNQQGYIGEDGRFRGMYGLFIVDVDIKRFALFFGE